MSPSPSKTDEFAGPGEVSGFDFDAAKGHLLVVVPYKLEEKVKTVHGESNAILADIHDISAGETAEEVLIFPKVLVASLNKRIGQKVLATLGQGVAKPGQNPPWILQDQSTNAKAVNAAKAYLKGSAPAKAEPAPPAPPTDLGAWKDDEDDSEAIPF